MFTKMFKKISDYEALGYFDLKVGEYFAMAKRNNISFLPDALTAVEMLEKAGPTIRCNCLINYSRNSLKRSIDIALCDIKKNEMHLEAAEKQTAGVGSSLRQLIISFARS